MTAVLTGAQELQARWLRVLRAEDEALGFAIGRALCGAEISAGGQGRRPPPWCRAFAMRCARISTRSPG